MIVTDVDRPTKIKAEAVLMALMAQRGPTVLGSNFQVSGAAVCEFNVVGSASAASPVPGTLAAAGMARANLPVGVVQVHEDASPAAGAGTESAKRSEKTVVPAAPKAAGPMTLRKAIFAAVRQELALSEDDIKVTLDSVSPLIDEPVAGDRRWQCRPLTRTFLGSVPFEAQLSEGTKVLEKLTVMAQVRQKQMVLVLTAPLSRRGVVLENQVRFEETWPDRKLTTLFSDPQEVVGLESQVDLAVGAQLDRRDFKPLMMAHRNDLLNVIYVAGSLEVQTQGRAMEDGKLHQVIKIRNDTTGKDFTAYLVGRNKAVVGTLSAEQEQKIREAE